MDVNGLSLLQGVILKYESWLWFLLVVCCLKALVML